MTTIAQARAADATLTEYTRVTAVRKALQSMFARNPEQRVVIRVIVQQYGGDSDVTVDMAVGKLLALGVVEEHRGNLVRWLREKYDIHEDETESGS